MTDDIVADGVKVVKPQPIDNEFSSALFRIYKGAKAAGRTEEMDYWDLFEGYRSGDPNFSDLFIFEIWALLEACESDLLSRLMSALVNSSRLPIAPFLDALEKAEAQDSGLLPVAIGVDADDLRQLREAWIGEVDDGAEGVERGR